MCERIKGTRKVFFFDLSRGFLEKKQDVYAKKTTFTQMGLYFANDYVKCGV